MAIFTPQISSSKPPSFECKQANPDSTSHSVSPSQKLLEESINRIKNYWSQNKEIGYPLVNLCKKIIICNEINEWSKSNVPIDEEVIKNLVSFFNQNPFPNFVIISEWAKKTVESVALGFFIQKFDKKKGPLPNKEKRIGKFVERTSPILWSKIAKNELVDTESLKGYVTILVENFNYDKRTTEQKIGPLLIYLDHTQYKQCPDIVKTIIDIGNSNAQTFIVGILSDNVIKTHLYSAQAANSKNDEPVCCLLRAIAELLNASHVQFFTYATDFLFQLLPNKTICPFLEKEVFGSFASGELLYQRVILLLKRVVETRDGKAANRLHHLRQLILKNKQLVNRFNNRDNPLDKQMRANVEQLILETYSWTELQRPQPQFKDVCLFNPLFNHLEKFMKIADGEMQAKIIKLFLELIEYHGDGQELVDASEACKNGFEEMSQLLKLCVARYNCPEIFNGAASAYLTWIFDCVFSITHVGNVTYQIKLELINKTINTFLEVTLEHIGRLKEKNTLLSLKAEMLAKFNNLTTANLKERVGRCETSFSHMLFHELYSDEDFKKWFRNENPSLQAKNTPIVDKILNQMDNTRKSVTADFGSILQKGGYQRVHNNQIGALAIVDSCIKDHNVFLNIGTGQGKSLIAEIAAIRLLQSAISPPQRVFIFTSYDHLAKRDWESMKFLSEGSGYQSIYISGQTTFAKALEDLEGAHIVHVDSEKFHLFLSHNFTEFLQGSIPAETVRNLMAILFNQKDNAIILDEGDLMILDDPKHIWNEGFNSIFQSTNIDMGSPAGKKQFDDLLGAPLIKGFNDYFPNTYNAWYDSVKSQTAQGSANIDVASGKKTRSADGFAHRVKQGDYGFHSLFFSFSSFARSFQQVLFLSGSIDEAYMPVFNKFFTNNKPNLFANIPLFVGSHNLSENLIRKLYPPCDDTSWLPTLLKDVREAIDRGQPILLFVADNQLGLIKGYLEKSLKPTRWLEITDERSLGLLGNEIRNIGNITLATTICGRGLDIKVSQAVEYGLHVVVSQLPEEPKVNERLLKQMIGRTARLGRKGTYSIIVKTDLQKFQRDAANKMNESLVSDELRNQDRRLEISQLFFSSLSSPDSGSIVLKTAQHLFSSLASSHSGTEPSKTAQRWVLLLNMIHHHKIDLLNDDTYQKTLTFLGVKTDNHTARHLYELGKEEEEKKH